MVNDSIRIGLTNDTSSLRGLSLLAYSQLSRYDSPSYYKLCAISRAAGILAARKKSIRRGYASKTPYSVKPQLISCYGFKIREQVFAYSSIEKETFQNTQGDKRLERKLWCEKCRMVMDRDRVAAINLARRGRVRFARSRPPINEAQGEAVEAVKGNPTPTVIPGVDAPKLTYPPIS